MLPFGIFCAKFFQLNRLQWNIGPHFPIATLRHHSLGFEVGLMSYIVPLEDFDSKNILMKSTSCTRS